MQNSFSVAVYLFPRIDHMVALWFSLGVRMIWVQITNDSYCIVLKLFCHAFLELPSLLHEGGNVWVTGESKSLQGVIFSAISCNTCLKNQNKIGLQTFKKCPGWHANVLRPLQSWLWLITWNRLWVSQVNVMVVLINKLGFHHQKGGSKVPVEVAEVVVAVAW